MPEVAKSRVGIISGLILLAGLALLLAGYLCAPLPPPQVVLSGQVLRAYGSASWTNRYMSKLGWSSSTSANMVISNAGASTVWWRQIDWELEVETADGLITNRPPYSTVAFDTMRPSFHDAFRVEAPPDALRWRVKATYHYNKHLNLRWEFADWLMEHPRLYQKAQSVPNILGALYRILPGAKEFEGTVCTPFFTNQAAVPPNP